MPTKDQYKETRIPSPSRPRFYALVYGQIVGVAIVILGMVFHWFRFDNATVPITVTVRVIAVAIVILFIVGVPWWRNSEIAKALGGGDATSNQDGFAYNAICAKNPSAGGISRWFYLLAPLRTVFCARPDNVESVQKLLWTVSYIDLVLLTYLVHITGGITGSMYSGIYLMLPSMPLLLRMGSTDVSKARWFTVFCGGGILLSFLMSHYGRVEYKASDSFHAYDLALAAVTLSGIIVLFFEIAIIRYQELKQAKPSSTESRNP
jgi:hypothetical protein